MESPYASETFLVQLLGKAVAAKASDVHLKVGQPPGARVRAVKEWAVRKFKMDPKDAADHVLQVCKSTARPASDTPLHQLLHGHDCALCFDLVPEKRVEG